MPHEGTTDPRAMSGVSALNPQAPAPQIFSFNRGNDWFNVSNFQNGNYLSEPELFDQINKPGYKPNQLYNSAESAYQGYLGMSPYKDSDKKNANSWAQGWNPIFLPNTGNVPGSTQAPKPGTSNQLPGTWDQPQLPSPASAAKQGNALTTPNPAAFGWAAQNPWANNQLVDRDPYGEFGQRRGL